MSAVEKNDSLKKINIHNLDLEGTIALVGHQILAQYAYEPATSETFWKIEQDLDRFGQQLIGDGTLCFFKSCCSSPKAFKALVKVEMSWKSSPRDSTTITTITLSPSELG